MEKFSKTLEQEKLPINGDLSKLDSLIDEKKKIKDEDELKLFISSIPEEWNNYKSSIELYLRHRDNIGYTNMDFNKVMFCYMFIRESMLKSAQRALDKYFTTDKQVNILKLTKILHNFGLHNPNKQLFVMSILNYIAENTQFEEEEVTGDQVGISC